MLGDQNDFSVFGRLVYETETCPGTDNGTVTGPGLRSHTVITIKSLHDVFLRVVKVFPEVI